MKLKSSCAIPQEPPHTYPSVLLVDAVYTQPAPRPPKVKAATPNGHRRCSPRGARASPRGVACTRGHQHSNAEEHGKPKTSAGSPPGSPRGRRRSPQAQRAGGLAATAPAALRLSDYSSPRQAGGATASSPKAQGEAAAAAASSPNSQVEAAPAAAKAGS
mmetsp:Transcript_88159/g.161860  ORF Transcript_88159/g.161860 Transcript_88159/m.161860 type:complete len:160 (+) Transcript_88159:88-567(+)